MEIWEQITEGVIKLQMQQIKKSTNYEQSPKNVQYILKPAQFKNVREKTSEKRSLLFLNSFSLRLTIEESHSAQTHMKLKIQPEEKQPIILQLVYPI